jgi:hypothetical protein
MRSCLLLLALALPAAANPAARIGTAAVVRGVVRAFPELPRAAGRVVGSGQPVYAGERIVTNAEGRLQILLLDGSIFTLGPNSSLVLDRYIYDPAKGKGELGAEAVKGVFRYISGKIAHDDPDAVRLKLPAGTLGIEGTEIMARLSSDGRTEVLLRSGRATLRTEAAAFEIRRPGDALVVVPGSVPRPPRPAEGALRRAFEEAFSPAAFATESPAQAAAAGSVVLAGVGGGEEAVDAAVEAVSAVGVEGAAAKLAEFILPAPTQSAAQAFVTGPSAWDDLKRVPGGTAGYSGSGTFTQLTDAVGLPCAVACTGAWTFNHSVDFAARTVTTSQSIVAGAIVDGAAGSFSFGALSGAAAFTSLSGGGGTYAYQFANADGEAAKSLTGTAVYAAGAVTGTGAAVTAPKTP